MGRVLQGPWTPICAGCATTAGAALEMPPPALVPWWQPSAGSEFCFAALESPEKPEPQRDRPLVPQQARGDPRHSERVLRPPGIRAPDMGRTSVGGRDWLDRAVPLLRVEAPLPVR